MIDKSNYPEYIDRFLNAETTLDEERELYEWFSRPDIPAEAMRWREMFGWYEGLGTESAQPAVDRSKPSPLRILPLTRWQWTGVAAMLAVLLTVGLWMRPTHTELSEYQAYEGSYIMRDGKKITDLSVVVPEVQRIEADINHHLAAMDSRFEGVDEEVDAMLMRTIEPENPRIREIIQSSL